MSRPLPPRPNLEHLKNQAKALLRNARGAGDKTITNLSDAQHAVAREYGFASWPKLQQHVKSLEAQASANLYPFRPLPKAADAGDLDEVKKSITKVTQHD